MPLELVNNGDSGLVARTKINAAITAINNMSPETTTTTTAAETTTTTTAAETTTTTTAAGTTTTTVNPVITVLYGTDDFSACNFGTPLLVTAMNGSSPQDYCGANLLTGDFSGVAAQFYASYNNNVRKWYKMGDLNAYPIDGCIDCALVTTTTTTTLNPNFVATIDTSLQSAPYSVTLPYMQGASINYTGTVDWGDGFISANEYGATHQYTVAGVYTITINGQIGGFNMQESPSLAAVLTSISNFGNQFAFNSATGFANLPILQSVSSDIPLTGSVANYFSGCPQFNADTSLWNTSTVTDMSFMFASSNVFNGNVSAWDVSNVTNMMYMFYGCTFFDQNIANWNVGLVTTMSYMLYNTSFSAANLTLVYNAWSSLPNLQISNDFAPINACYYSSAQTGRDTLVNAYMWNLADNGVCP